MKTTYQRLHKYGINDMVFGKSKKKEYVLYWALIAALFIIGVLI